MILVIDDEKQIRILTKHFFGVMNNVEVEAYGNPEEAYTEENLSKTTLVLLDLEITGQQNGIEVSKILLKSKHRKDFTVLLYSGSRDLYGKEITDDRLESLGFDGFIPKDGSGLGPLEEVLNIYKERKANKQ